MERAGLCVIGVKGCLDLAIFDGLLRAAVEDTTEMDAVPRFDSKQFRKPAVQY